MGSGGKEGVFSNLVKSPNVWEGYLLQEGSWREDMTHRCGKDTDDLE